MKPLVSTSVYGLVPLPQLPERNGDEWKAATDALPAEPPELSSGDLCCRRAEDRLASIRSSADRLVLYAQLIFSIWRRRGEDR